MLRDIQAYCVIFLICLFRLALTAGAIYRKTAEAKLYTQYINESSENADPRKVWGGVTPHTPSRYAPVRHVRFLRKRWLKSPENT